MENKIGILIDAYCNTPQKVELLEKILSSLSPLKEKYFLVVASHTPVSLSVQSVADIVIYDSNNVVDDRKYSHGVAESMLIEQGIMLMKYYGIKAFHKITYDSELNDLSIFDEWENKDKKFVGTMWNGTDIGIDICCFYADIAWFEKRIPFYRNIDEMFAISNMLEICWGSKLSAKDREECYIYTNGLEMFHDYRYKDGKNKLNLINQ